MKNWLKWFILVYLALVWGSSFILMKKGLVAFSNLEVGSFRVLLAAIVLLPFSLKALRYFSRSELIKVAVVGMVGNMIPAYLFATAQVYVPSSLAGMLNSLVPLFTVVIGAIFFSISTNRKQWIGVLIGLVGALTLILGSGKQINDIPFLPSLMVVLATICYALSVNVIYRFLSKRSSVNVAAIALLLASPIPFFYLGYSGFWLRAFSSEENIIAVGYLSILAVVGTALAVVVFNYLIQKSSAVFSSSVTYLIPVVAMVWGLLDGEAISLQQALAVGGIFIAIRMINSR
jgi:drug/metabolite transporter (DMT)-like permease